MYSLYVKAVLSFLLSFSFGSHKTSDARSGKRFNQIKIVKELEFI